MNEERIDEAKAHSDMLRERSFEVYGRIEKAKVNNGLIAFGISLLIGAAALHITGDLSLAGFFLIPSVGIGALVYRLTDKFYLRQERHQAIDTFLEALDDCCRIEQEELGNG